MPRLILSEAIQLLADAQPRSPFNDRNCFLPEIWQGACALMQAGFSEIEAIERAVMAYAELERMLKAEAA